MDELLIVSADLNQKKFKLKKPYVLSFKTIDEVSSILLELKLSNGKSAVAEVVPLFGYSTETEEDIMKFLQVQSKKIIGLTTNTARTSVAGFVHSKPFSTSPVLTAIDLFSGNFQKNPETEKISFVIPASSSELEELAETMKMNIAPVIKLKISGNLNKDVQALKLIFENKEKFSGTFRIDANQAYKMEDAKSLYNFISENEHTLIEYVEQPLGTDDWAGHAELVKLFPNVKTMLDESIIDESDLQKAIEIEIPFIKLKLFKQGGIKELIGLAEKAYANEMKVVIGNGVATAVSNDVENLIYLQYRHIFHGPSEANGFLKLQ